MKISRRQFIELCGASAVFLVGCPPSSITPGTPLPPIPDGTTKVIWLHGSGCSGCSVSFLNRLSPDAPQTAADVLLDVIELTYHYTLMGAVGEPAALAAEAVYASSPYLLVVEGGVPTAFQGAACATWTVNDQEVTFVDVVKRYAERAARIFCIGNCAAWGGVPAAPPNPTAVQSVSAVTGKTTLNVPGCPAHPDWFVWAVAQTLAGNAIPLDRYGRPTSLFNRTVHDQCPRRETEEADTFGVDRRCLKELGCRGPETQANCPVHLWNGGVNWCIDANAPCIGCAQPSFPAATLLGEGEDGEEGDD